jgi:hypothetical protein
MTLTYPVVPPSPADDVVQTIQLDLLGLKEELAGKAWSGPKQGLARLSAARSDLALKPTRAHLLKALLDLTTHEKHGLAAMAFVDPGKLLPAFRARYPKLQTLHVFASEGFCLLPTRDEAPDLHALLDPLAALGVRWTHAEET